MYTITFPFTIGFKLSNKTIKTAPGLAHSNFWGTISLGRMQNNDVLLKWS